MKHVIFMAALMLAIPAMAEDALVELDLELPKPAFAGTPKNVPLGTTVEKPTGKPRPAIKVPKGTVNLALGKEVRASDEEPIIGEIELITDGDKEATEGSYLEIGPGPQWVQVDLGDKHVLYAILLWHYHGDPRVYHDVVIQTASDPDFIMDVQTLYNNDHDNSSGLGLGEDKEFFELFEGRYVGVDGVEARFVRFYVNGSTVDELSRYTEIEIYGLEN